MPFEQNPDTFVVMNDDTRISLLVADDHQMIIDGVKNMLLRDRQYAIEGEANDGEQALALIAQDPYKYQVLLTDVKMPKLTGIELCKEVKATYPHIKVLVLSVFDNAEIIHDALDAEADGYILKNATRQEFLTALQRICEHGTYFSQDVLPVILEQYQKEKKQEQDRIHLTAREKEVLTLIVKELTSEEIARELFISKKTVDAHRSNLLEKSKSKTTIGLVKLAIKNGLADL